MIEAHYIERLFSILSLISIPQYGSDLPFYLQLTRKISDISQKPYTFTMIFGKLELKGSKTNYNY